MWSSDVIGGLDIATAEQYNRLRKDAQASSYLMVRQQSTPDDTFHVEPGHRDDGTNTIVVALFNSASIVAPVTDPRIDLISVDNLGVVTITTGAEAPVPTAPAIPGGHLVLAEVFLRVGGTLILNDDDTVNHYITDRRPFLSLGGGGSGGTKYVHTEAVASDTWTVNHGKGTGDLLIMVWGADNKQLGYEDIEIINANTIEITFTAPVTGRAIVW